MGSFLQTLQRHSASRRVPHQAFQLVPSMRWHLGIGVTWVLMLPLERGQSQSYGDTTTRGPASGAAGPAREPESVPWPRTLWAGRVTVMVISPSPPPQLVNARLHTTSTRPSPIHGERRECQGKSSRANTTGESSNHPLRRGAGVPGLVVFPSLCRATKTCVVVWGCRCSAGVRLSLRGSPRVGTMAAARLGAVTSIWPAPWPSWSTSTCSPSTTLG